MLKENVKYLHLRVEKNGKLSDTGGYCVAYIRKDAGVKFAIAMCKTTQQYNANLGEQVARERLKRGNSVFQSFAEFDSTIDTLQKKMHNT